MSTATALTAETRGRCPSPACVVKVGDGRGFIIEHRIMTPPSVERAVRASMARIPGRKRSTLRLNPYRDYRLVITAAHCLPKLPPAHAMSYTSDRTYAELLGTLDGSKKGVWAECLFVNPVADIAVLGCPDGQELGDEADAYDELAENAPALRIGKARSGPGWVLSLDGQWTRTAVRVDSFIGGTSLSFNGPNAAGMSGSPILNDSGRAVRVVVVGSVREGKPPDEYEVQPMLTRDLPGWLLEGGRQ